MVRGDLVSPPIDGGSKNPTIIILTMNFKNDAIFKKKLPTRLSKIINYHLIVSKAGEAENVGTRSAAEIILQSAKRKLVADRRDPSGLFTAVVIRIQLLFVLRRRRSGTQ